MPDNNVWEDFQVKIPDKHLWEEAMACQDKSKKKKPPDSETKTEQTPESAGLAKDLEKKFPEVQRKKTQAGKYAQVIRSIAKVIALGPYDKIQDPEENNITVVRNFVDKMDQQMGEDLADFLKYVFPDQIRKGTADMQDEQQRMLGILTNELRKSKVLLSDLIA
jgi:hypothetical protein